MFLFLMNQWAVKLSPVRLMYVNVSTWLVVSCGRFLIRIFLLLLSSLRVFSSRFSISSGSSSGRSLRMVIPSDAASSSCRLAGLSDSGWGEFSRFIECTFGGWMDEAAAILKRSVESESERADRWASVLWVKPIDCTLESKCGWAPTQYSWRPPPMKN